MENLIRQRDVGQAMALFSRVKEGEKRSGGLAFFASLFFLSVIGLSNLTALPSLITFESMFRLALVALGTVTGALMARLLVTGTFSVFIHELKHSIVSNLSGNRARGMILHRSSGSFTYEYTERTRAYNAFISLAPYWFPLAQIGTLASLLPFLYRSHELLTLFTAVAYGFDLVLNLRDVSPHQTDFSRIRGGFRIGVAYAVSMNVTLTTIALAWWLQGLAGLWQLVGHLRNLLEFMIRL